MGPIHAGVSSAQHQNAKTHQLKTESERSPSLKNCLQSLSRTKRFRETGPSLGLMAGHLIKLSGSCSAGRPISVECDNFFRSFRSIGTMRKTTMISVSVDLDTEGKATGALHVGFTVFDTANILALYLVAVLS